MIKSIVKKVVSLFQRKEVVYIQFSRVNPDKRFEGKKILVTGGTSGVGFEIAKEFIAEGAKVMITGRRTESLEKAKSELKSDRVSTLVWDIENVSQDEEKLKDVITTLGDIDVFVNNAGIYDETTWSLIDETMYDKIVDINSKGLFFICQAEGKYFIERNRKGKIINICSIAGIKSGFDPYSVSKWGSVCITKGLAKHLTCKGVIVNGVAPGNVVTNIHKGVKGKSVEENAYTAQHLTHRYTLVEEVAGMVLYLSSDLGSNIVGQVIPIDGGWTIY